MADEPENLVLVYLRRIDAKVDALAGEVREVKERLSAVEVGLASVRRDLGFLAEADARLQMSFDRLRDDVTRIERRLDLVDEPAA
ncbi:hypothetical protein [Brevundimonas aurifodinae]|jgi:predicted nuclease with TOPRIM domain|uniref:DUF4164 family protein n=2 Tax=Brevundimonas TaxID=41275 RepID=A0ABV1NRU9_9CAUL|nr:MAG: hypothetical protein B7Z42_11565 [Brevundimonas sp. 12-68-7]OYX33758.1 MAG: hypothetical protein B7Z01_08400 [Brevundimonas subvibrioides]